MNFFAGMEPAKHGESIQQRNGDGTSKTWGRETHLVWLRDPFRNYGSTILALIVNSVNSFPGAKCPYRWCQKIMCGIHVCAFSQSKHACCVCPTSLADDTLYTFSGWWFGTSVLCFHSIWDNPSH